MFIAISDSDVINVDNIESITRKGKMTTQVLMQSGDKLVAEMPFDLFIKRVQSESGESVKSILKNIDKNTNAFRA